MSADVIDFYRGMRVLRPPALFRVTAQRLRLRGVFVLWEMDKWFEKPENASAA